MQRTMGRILISAAAVQTVVVPVLAEWSAGEVAGDQRPRVARARGVVSLAMNGAVAPVALWMIWRRRPAAGAAAVLVTTYWGSFLVTALPPGGVAEDVGELVPGVAGIPGHVAAAVWGMLAAGLGWYLARQPAGGTSRQ